MSNPKLATEQQVKEVSDTFTEIINHQGKQIKALESGVIDAIEPSSPAPIKRGEYKVTKPGIYLNFKDGNGQPISVTEEDYSSGNVSIIFNGTDSRKLIVPITFEGEVKEGDTRGVSGMTVYAKTLAPVELGIISKIIKGDNIASILLNNNYSDNFLWGKGYLDKDAKIISHDKWFYTKNKYPIEAGNYTLWLYLTSNTHVIIFDLEGNIQRTINNTKADIPYNFKIEYDGFIQYSVIIGNMNFQPRLITHQDFINTTVTSDVFSTRNYVDSKMGIKESYINLIESKDFNLFDQGYLTKDDLILFTNSWLSSFFIPIKAGDYISNLYLTENAYMHLYDSNLKLYSSINNIGQGGNLNEWELTVEKDGYIRYCLPMYSSSNNLYLSPTFQNYQSSLFVSHRELEMTFNSVIQPQHDFCEGIQNSLGKDSFWEKGFYNDKGEISIENSWLNTRIRIEPGIIFINGYFIGNAKYVVFDKNGEVVQVISGIHRNGDEYGHVYFNELLHKDAYEIGISYRVGVFGIENIKNIKLILKNKISTTTQNISELNILNTVSAVNSLAVVNALQEKERDVIYYNVRMPIVSLVSDDLHNRNKDWFIPLLEENNLLGTFACITGFFNNPDEKDNYFTKKEVIELHKKGHDIVSHTVNHERDLHKQSIDHIAYELLKSKLDLLELGINPNGYISPFGERNAKIDEIVRKYYNWNTITNGELMSNVPPINRLYLQRFPFDGITYDNRPKLDVLKERIDECFDSKGWLIITIHPQYSEYANEVRKQEYQEMIDYVRSKKINILPITHAYDFYKNKIQNGDIGIDAKKIVGMDGTKLVQ